MRFTTRGRRRRQRIALRRRFDLACAAFVEELGRVLERFATTDQGESN
jgi:hypothetical protein